MELAVAFMLAIGLALIAWWAVDRARHYGVSNGLPGSAVLEPLLPLPRHRHRPPVARAASGFPRVRRPGIRQARPCASGRSSRTVRKLLSGGLSTKPVCRQALWSDRV
jgi:hypothetical protein